MKKITFAKLGEEIRQCKEYVSHLTGGENSRTLECLFTRGLRASPWLYMTGESGQLLTSCLLNELDKETDFLEKLRS